MVEFKSNALTTPYVIVRMWSERKVIGWKTYAIAANRSLVMTLRSKYKLYTRAQ